MKALLITPYSFTIRGLIQVPLGIMLVGGFAQKYGHTVKILDRNYETNARRIIDDFKPDVVGISSMTGPMLIDGLKLSKYIKEKFLCTKVIWGGIHASTLPENTLLEDYIDYVVIGEGEKVFVELLDAIENKKDLSAIKGIAYKEDGRIIVNKRRPLLEDMDSVSLVPWDLIDVKKYLKYETLFITSRGCPHRCAFCYNEKFNFSRWRGMSAERVKAEIEHAKLYHPIRRFRFDEDNFCVNKKRCYQILDFLPKEAPLYLSTRIEYVDEEFCRRLSEFKDAFVFTGVESGDNEVLKRFQKDITIEDTKRAYSLINKYKIKTSGSFIIGGPGETREELSKTLKLIDEIKPTRPSCCIFVPLPGSVLTDQLMRKGKLNHLKRMEDWARYSRAEYGSKHQFGEIQMNEICKIYSRYWRKFIWSFVINLRFKWIFLGFKNVIENYYRLLLKLIHKDI